MSRFQYWICGSTLGEFKELCEHVRQCKYADTVPKTKLFLQLDKEIQHLEKQIQDRRVVQENLFKFEVI